MFRSLPRRALLWATLPALLLTANASATTTTADDPHKGEIQIESWSLEPVRSGSGMSAGKVHYSDLSVMISLEKASPVLLLKCAEGTHYDSVEIRSGDDKRQDYLTVTLKEVMVSSYELVPGEKLAKVTLRVGTGKTMAAEVLASPRGGVNALLLDGSVR